MKNHTNKFWLKVFSLVLFTIVVVVSGCKKEDENPIKDLNFRLLTTDSTGAEKTKFAEGEDVYFEVQEANPTRNTITYYRTSNIIESTLKVLDSKDSAVGDLKGENFFEILVAMQITLHPRQITSLKGHWFENPENVALPRGMYKATYEVNVHNEGGGNARSFTLAKEFYVE